MHFSSFVRPVYVIQNNMYSAVLCVFYAFRQEVRVEISPRVYVWEVPSSKRSLNTGYPNRPLMVFQFLAGKCSVSVTQ